MKPPRTTKSTSTTDQDSVELLQKITNLSLEPDSSPVLVPFTAADIELWKEFAEYKKNRKEWDSWRDDDWKKHHPPHISELFNDWPILETPRLRLRLVRGSDAEDIFRVLSNPTAMKYYGTLPHKDLDYTQRQYIDVMMSRFKFRDAVSFVVTFKEDDKYIGHVNAMQFDRVFKFAEIAYIIDQEYWGKGIGTEAVGKVVEFLIEKMKIHKIRAAFFAKNVASKRVLEKVGFKQEGYLRDNVLIDEEFEDEYSMALIASNSDTDK
jgi:ribosomal-protein-alanine N-acetyltransferase